LILLEVIKSSNFLIFSSSLNLLGIAFSIIFWVYIPSTLCLLISLAKISFIFSSKPEIAFGIFIGLSSFIVLTEEVLNTFLLTVFFFFLIVFGLEIFDDCAVVFFLIAFFLISDFFFWFTIFL